MYLNNVTKCLRGTALARYIGSNTLAYNAVTGANGNSGSKFRRNNVINCVGASSLARYAGGNTLDTPSKHDNNVITITADNRIATYIGGKGIRSSIGNVFNTGPNCGHVNKLTNNTSTSTTFASYIGGNSIFSRLNYHANNFINRGRTGVAGYRGGNIVLSSRALSKAGCRNSN